MSSKKPETVLKISVTPLIICIKRFINIKITLILGNTYSSPNQSFIKGVIK